MLNVQSVWCGEVRDDLLALNLWRVVPLRTLSEINCPSH